jgi:uncharacterized membrane protein
MAEETVLPEMKSARVPNQPAEQRRTRLVPTLIWWMIFLVSAVFGAYALAVGLTELLHQLGLMQDAPPRAVPLAFVIHALTGGLVLIIGPLQFNGRLRRRWRRLHRLLGRIYVGAIWLASVTGLWSAVFFAESSAAQIAFGLAAVLWFVATTLAFLRARAHRFQAHREWMTRSFAVSLFFVTFPIWVEGLASTSLPPEVSYPLGISLGWILNLVVAELWIRHERQQKRRVATI